LGRLKNESKALPMPDPDKKQLSERDICTKYITPAVVGSTWDVMSQIMEEVQITKGRVIVRKQLSTRVECKRADYVLAHPPSREPC
jgi:type I restriction enzyme, R subunit